MLGDNNLAVPDALLDDLCILRAPTLFEKVLAVKSSMLENKSFSVLLG